MTAEAGGGGASAAQARGARRRLRTWHLLVLWGALMAPLATWGLPSKDTDDLLFAGQPAWSAARFRAEQALQERAGRTGGADTDIDPLADRSRLIDLTPDDAARAAILLRYRLYSRQPDEMITFMALQRMKPRQLDFDPRLYQYGGAYIYTIGAAVGAAAALGVTRLTSDVGAYLEQPELFARFFVVARVVSLVFGAAALVAVVRLARRAAGRGAGWAAFLCVAASPVFITGVLEAKPHLPSACLILWAAEAALALLGGGAPRVALRMGALAGLAFGFVLTGVVAAALGVAFLLRRQRVWRSAALFGVAFAAVYVGTNPYVAYNALFNRAALASNLSNSTAMYSLDRFGEGAVRVGELLVESCGWGTLALGAIGATLLLRRFPRESLTVAAPAVALLGITIALGAGKPAEYARFLLLPVLLLGVAAGALIARAARGSLAGAAALLAAALVLSPGWAYVRSFALDARGESESRRAAARYLLANAAEHEAIGVVQEPAPYAIPPLDFVRRRIVRLPLTHRPEADAPVDVAASGPAGAPASIEELPRWLVLTADDESAIADAWWRAQYRVVARFPAAGTRLSPIAWANKAVFVFERYEAKEH